MESLFTGWLSADKQFLGWKIIKEPVPEVDDKVIVSAVSATDSNIKYSHPPTCNNHGVVYPPSCSEKRWDMLNSTIKYHDSDVLIVSYPKSGTTWVEQTALLLLQNGDSSRLNPSTKNVYRPGMNTVGKIWPESALEQVAGLESKMGQEFARLTIEEFDSAPAPRVLKSHAPPELLPGLTNTLSESSSSHHGLKLLVVSRNPLDCVVSRFYHAFNPSKQGWDFEAWAALCLSGDVVHGDWFQWVKSWHARSQSNPKQILWLQYEELKSDPETQIKRIAEFLNIEPTPDLIYRVAHYSSFDSMKEQAAAKGGDFSSHLRKGIVGDWRNHFSSDMKDLYFKRYNDEMAGSGLSYSIGEGDYLKAPPDTWDNTFSCTVN